MQRKPTKNTRGPNAAEKRFQKWVKSKTFCVACLADAPVILHHCEGATFRHKKVLVGHWFVLGLCQQCDDIVTHGSRRALRDAHGPQSEMWRVTHNVYAEQTGNRASDEIVNAIMDWGR